MPRSMTGYGMGRESNDDLNVTVELRGVNNRFFDINLKLPRSLYPHDPEIRDLVRKRIPRGRISLLANIEYSKDHTPELRLDRARAISIAKGLKELRMELNIEGEIKLDHFSYSMSKRNAN